jgi:putative FmdB family regulatory protein
MPIYEYVCTKCKTHVEKLQKITDKPLTKCSNCGGRLEKQWSSTSFQLKGSGWYATDYASKKSGTTEEKVGGAEEKKTEASEPAASNDSAAAKERDKGTSKEKEKSPAKKSSETKSATSASKDSNASGD